MRRAKEEETALSSEAVTSKFMETHLSVGIDSLRRANQSRSDREASLLSASKLGPTANKTHQAAPLSPADKGYD